MQIGLARRRLAFLFKDNWFSPSYYAGNPASQATSVGIEIATGPFNLLGIRKQGQPFTIARIRDPGASWNQGRNKR
jgi:hypothetical protein